MPEIKVHRVDAASEDDLFVIRWPGGLTTVAEIKVVSDLFRWVGRHGTTITLDGLLFLSNHETEAIEDRIKELVARRQTQNAPTPAKE